MPFGIPPQLRVTLAHQPEGVLVEAHPEMQPVLLDPIGRAPARRPLAAQPPAELVHGDLEAPFQLGPTQLESGRHRRAPTADDRDLDACLAHRPRRARYQLPTTMKDRSGATLDGLRRPIRSPKILAADVAEREHEVRPEQARRSLKARFRVPAQHPRRDRRAGDRGERVGFRKPQTGHRAPVVVGQRLGNDGRPAPPPLALRRAIRHQLHDRSHPGLPDRLAERRPQGTCRGQSRTNGRRGVEVDLDVVHAGRVVRGGDVAPADRGAGAASIAEVESAFERPCPHGGQAPVPSNPNALGQLHGHRPGRAARHQIQS